MQSTGRSEGKAQAYGIVAFILAVLNVVLSAGLLIVLFRLDDPLSLADNPQLVKVTSAAVTLALALTVITLVLAVESLDILSKIRGKGSATAIIALFVGAIFAAAFASFGSLATIENWGKEAGQEEALCEGTREKFVHHWQSISLGILRELLGLVQEVAEWRQGPDRNASGPRASESQCRVVNLRGAWAAASVAAVNPSSPGEALCSFTRSSDVIVGAFGFVGNLPKASLLPLLLVKA